LLNLLERRKSEPAFFPFFYIFTFFSNNLSPSLSSKDRPQQDDQQHKQHHRCQEHDAQHEPPRALRLLGPDELADACFFVFCFVLFCFFQLFFVFSFNSLPNKQTKKSPSPSSTFAATSWMLTSTLSRMLPCSTTRTPVVSFVVEGGGKVLENSNEETVSVFFPLEFFCTEEK